MLFNLPIFLQTVTLDNLLLFFYLVLHILFVLHDRVQQLFCIFLGHLVVLLLLLRRLLLLVIVLVLLLVLLLILFFVLFLGYRFYRALKPVGKGIESLVEQEPLCLREKGMAGDLARKLNRVSDILQEQKKKLSRRDQARTEWISGVSHDIRTPLALILG